MTPVGTPARAERVAAVILARVALPRQEEQTAVGFRNRYAERDDHVRSRGLSSCTPCEYS